LGGWKHSGKNTNGKFQQTGFNTLYEAILPNTKGVCSIMISDIKLFNAIETKITDILKFKIEEDKKKFKEEDLRKDTKALKIKEDILPEKEKLFSISSLFEIINTHTKKYIDKEISFFKKYETDKTRDIVESLEQIKVQIAEDNSACILKMSAGSGFHSITGDWQYDNFTNTGNWTGGRNEGKKKYKSRKIAVDNNVFSLMGFVKLRIMTDQEFFAYHTKQEQVKQKIAEQKRIEREKTDQEQEQRRLEQERKALEKAKEQIQNEKIRLEQEKAEQERLANLSPDDREKEKYINAQEIGNLVNDSIKKEDLTSDFYKWLKEYLCSKKLWDIDTNNKKNKWVKRCLTIEEKLK
jgi:hypothetical protein